MFSVNYIFYLLASFLAVVIVLTMHEFAHAFVAYKCGDYTPKLTGRLSLNPLRHFDLAGLIFFTLVGFGWAKPVQINPNNFKKYRLGLALTSVAGVAVNFLSAFLFYPLFLVVVNYLGRINPYLYEFLYDFTNLLFAYSLSFCVFNLLPLHPLDGFRIVDALNRRRGKIYTFLRDYGHFILIFLILESFICNVFVDMGVGIMDYFSILGWFMKFGTGILGYPVRALWGLVPW